MTSGLSYRALTTPAGHYNEDDDDDNFEDCDEEDEEEDWATVVAEPRLRRALALEERVAEWLDGQLLEAERRRRYSGGQPLPAGRHNQNRDDRIDNDNDDRRSTTTTTPAELQDRLVRETADLQAEHRLLVLWAASQSAREVLFHSPTSSVPADGHGKLLPEQNDGNQDPSAAAALDPSAPVPSAPRRAPLPSPDDRDPHALLVVRQAVEARDRRTRQSLELAQRLDDVRRRHAMARNDLEAADAANRALWTARKEAAARQRDEDDDEEHPHHSRRVGSGGPRWSDGGGTAASLPQQQRLRARVLRPLLADLIAAGSLDWHCDERLRRILQL